MVVCIRSVRRIILNGAHGSDSVYDNFSDFFFVKVVLEKSWRRLNNIKMSTELANSMEQRSSSKRNPSIFLALNQTNTVQALPTDFINIHFNIFLSSTPRSCKCIFYSGFSTKTFIRLRLPHVTQVPSLSFSLSQ